MSFSKDLLNWYDQNHRHLPWRANPGEKPNPYHVWISEIMLQQTTVPTVIDYFNRFIHKWPSITKLATASLDDILHSWQGLGYYSRARNLHKCAQTITLNHDGLLPQTEKELLALPGIGPYTAAAILSIAFDTPTPVIDGNIERILSRLFIIDIPISKSKNLLKSKASLLTPVNRSGDFAQAMMDLGSETCTPKKPNCANCPIQNYCKAYDQNIMEQYPIKIKAKPKPEKHGYVYLIFNNKQQVFLEKRPSKGLLAGMFGFPTSEWTVEKPNKKDLENTKWQDLCVTQKTIKHTFTHFHLFLTIVTGTSNESGDMWKKEINLKDYAIPTLMKKVWKNYKNVEQAGL